LTVGFAIMALLAPEAALACPGCGLGADEKTTAAYRASVLVMMAGPYLTVAGIAGILYFAWRRSRRGAGD
jgi:hypothetical protein